MIRQEREPPCSCAGSRADGCGCSLGWRTARLPDLPVRAVSVITLAATVGRIADLGLEAADPSLVAGEAGRRLQALRRLQRAADEALETATNVAALAIAGYLPADRLP